MVWRGNFSVLPSPSWQPDWRDYRTSRTWLCSTACWNKTMIFWLTPNTLSLCRKYNLYIWNRYAQSMWGGYLGDTCMMWAVFYLFVWTVLPTDPGSSTMSSVLLVLITKKCSSWLSTERCQCLGAAGWGWQCHQNLKKTGYRGDALCTDRYWSADCTLMCLDSECVLLVRTVGVLSVKENKPSDNKRLGRHLGHVL